MAQLSEYQYLIDKGENQQKCSVDLHIEWDLTYITLTPDDFTCQLGGLLGCDLMSPPIIQFIP